MRYSIEFLRFLRYDVVRTVGFCSLFNFVADNMIESSFFTVSREEQVSTIQFRVSAWLIREDANIFLRPSSHTDLVPIAMDSYWESILCHSIHGLLMISTIRLDGSDGNRISTNLRTEDRFRSILFMEEARVNLVQNETYKRCLSFVLENAIAELKSSVYGFFIRHACVFHVSNVGERTLDGFSRKRKAIMSASELFDMLESSLQHDISLRIESPVPVLPVQKRTRNVTKNVPCTRLGCAKISSYIESTTKTKESICYDNGRRHMLGQRPKLKSIPSLVSFPLLETSIARSRIATLGELVAFHSLLKENGIIAPRDTWEDWIRNCDDDEDCDRAFMCLMVIVMSSSTSDRQLGELVPRLFLAGITSAEGVIDIVRLYGVNCFCSLLSETGRYYQNAERIINAADYFVAYHNGRVPDDISTDELCQLYGVGYKTANIILTMAFNRMDGIPSDIHVLRWAKMLGWWTNGNDGYLCSKSIEQWLPLEWWPYVNPVFGSFGQLLSSAYRGKVLHLVRKFTSKKVRHIFAQACATYRRQNDRKLITK